MEGREKGEERGRGKRDEIEKEEERGVNGEGNEDRVEKR